MTTAITCIYCRRSNIDTIFDRDHVIPESLGKFEPVNLLLDCVCKDCNNSLGRTIEDILGRDSIEAFLRFTHGLKSLSKTDELKNIRAVLRAPAVSSEINGSFLKLASDAQGILTKTPFQIRVFNRANQQYEYFRENDLQLLKHRKDELELNKLELHGSPTTTEIEWQRIRQKLDALFSEIGLHNVSFGEINDTTSSINVPVIREQIDVLLQRALMKIAFNYLALAAKQRNVDQIIWHPQLEPIRQFIRYGTELADPIFSVEEEKIDWPIELNEQSAGVHLLALDWIFHRNGRKTLRVRVSLFNSQTYVFRLISNFPERPLPRISMGHVFKLYGPSRKCREFNIREFMETCL